MKGIYDMTGKKSFWKTAFLILSALLLLNALYLLLFSNYHSGILIVFFLGVFFLVRGLFYERITQLTRRGVFLWLRICVYAGACLTLVFCLFLFFYGQHDTVTYKEDVLIVLGAGVHGERVSAPLACRLDAAFLYAEKNPSALIVVSGGQGPQEDIPEALAMKRYLEAKGLSSSRILMEDASSSTVQNFLYSKALLDTHFEEPYSVAFVTNGFHIYRAEQYALQVGLTPAHLHAALPWYSMPVNYLRECLAVLQVWIFPKKV